MKNTNSKEMEIFYPKSREEWRNWLSENHINKDSIWVIYYKKNSDKPSISYSDAVDEALCFGWIDSKSKPIDSEKYMQFFCKRKESSVWSKINKEKIKKLDAAGLMAAAGYAIIEKAKKNGNWNILDEAEELIRPKDLEIEFQKYPEALEYFTNLSRSDQRNILQWLVLAKRTETRQNRIIEIVSLANLKQKPKQFSRQSK